MKSFISIRNNLYENESKIFADQEGFNSYMVSNNRKIDKISSSSSQSFNGLDKH